MTHDSVPGTVTASLCSIVVVILVLNGRRFKSGAFVRLSESGKISHFHGSIMPRVHRTRIDKADVGQRCTLHRQPESCNHMLHSSGDLRGYS
jgi:hypothetical protein